MTEGKQTYYCKYCNEPYTTEEEAEECYNKHNIVYMQISTDDLNKLQMFMFSKDEKFISKSLMHTIQVYTKRAAERQFHNENLRTL